MKMHLEGPWASLFARVVLLCLSLSCTLSAAAQTLIPTQATFEAECARLEELTDAGDWSEVHQGWMELIRAHAGKDYVRVRLPEIREAVQRSAFWAGRKRPEVKDLVSGKLVKGAKRCWTCYRRVHAAYVRSLQ